MHGKRRHPEYAVKDFSEQSRARTNAYALFSRNAKLRIRAAHFETRAQSTQIQDFVSAKGATSHQSLAVKSHSINRRPVSKTKLSTPHTTTPRVVRLESFRVTGEMDRFPEGINRSQGSNWGLAILRWVIISLDRRCLLRHEHPRRWLVSLRSFRLADYNDYTPWRQLGSTGSRN